jgi:hypothetical protein
MEEGLLSSLFKGTMLSNIGLRPQVMDKDIVIEISEQQFKEMVFSGFTGENRTRALNSVDIKLLEGKIIVKIKLF